MNPLFAPSFFLMYLAAGALIALIAFLESDFGQRPLSYIGPAGVAFIFIGVSLWPCVLLAAALGGMSGNCRRTYGR